MWSPWNWSRDWEGHNDMAPEAHDHVPDECSSGPCILQSVLRSQKCLNNTLTQWHVFDNVCKVRYFSAAPTKIGLAQADLELLNSNDPPHSASWVLGLQACIIMVGHKFLQSASYPVWCWMVLDKRTIEFLNSSHGFCSAFLVGEANPTNGKCIYTKHDLIQISSIAFLQGFSCWRSYVKILCVQSIFLIHFPSPQLLLLPSCPYFYIFVHGLPVYNAHLLSRKMSYPQGQAWQGPLLWSQWWLLFLVVLM